MTIPVKKSQEARYNFDPESFFWGRRPDGVAINEALQIVYMLEFKRSTDRDEGFLQVKEAEANDVTADRLLKATSTPSSKSLMYKKGKKTSSSPIM